MEKKNIYRKRTQRTHALSKQELQDNSLAGLNRKQRRTLAMVAHARRQRLGTGVYGLGFDKDGVLSHSVRDKSFDNKYDNSTFKVCQLKNLDKTPFVHEFKTHCKDTDPRTQYRPDRAVLDKQQRKRGKN